MFKSIKEHRGKLLIALVSILLIGSLIIGTIPGVRSGLSDFLTTSTSQVAHIFTIGTVEAAATPDYTCTGTSDNTVFQTALNALSSGGGELDVLAGTYNFTATVSRAIDNVTIRGVGKATYFTWNTSSAIFSAGSRSGWVFSDFATDGGSLTVTSATKCVESNIWIGTSYTALWVSTDVTNTSVRVPTGSQSTYTVAASDSSAREKLQADWVCDGTADQTQIQAAIDALPEPGGSVTLCGGNYNTTDTIHFDPIDHTGAVIFNAYGAIINYTGSWSIITIMHNVVPTGYCGNNRTIIQGVRVVGVTTAAIGILIEDSQGNIIRDTVVENVYSDSTAGPKKGAYSIYAAHDSWAEYNSFENIMALNCGVALNIYGVDELVSFYGTSVTNLLFQAVTGAANNRGIEVANGTLNSCVFTNCRFGFGAGCTNAVGVMLGSNGACTSTFIGTKMELFGVSSGVVFFYCDYARSPTIIAPMSAGTMTFEGGSCGTWYNYGYHGTPG